MGVVRYLVSLNRKYSLYLNNTELKIIGIIFFLISIYYLVEFILKKEKVSKNYFKVILVALISYLFLTGNLRNYYSINIFLGICLVIIYGLEIYKQKKNCG